MNNKRQTVLIVDDVSHLREIITSEFIDEGYNVIEAQNGDEAFEQAIKNDVDLVITDVRMPQGSGGELLEKLKKINSIRPRIFVLTAFSDLVQEELLDKGAEKVIEKPFDPEELLRYAKHALSQNFSKNIDSVNQYPQLKMNFDELILTQQGQGVLLGRGGIFLPKGKENYKKLDYINFDLNFTKGEIKKLNFTGQIEWVRNYLENKILQAGYGISFSKMDEKQSQIINKITTKHKILSYIPLGKG